MLSKNQTVTLRERLVIRARKGKSLIVLGEAGDKFRVIKPHETMKGYYYMRGSNDNCPPMSVIAQAEVEV